MRSIHHRLAAHRACVHGLGLRRMHQVVEVEDTPATRGMLNKVSYMVSWWRKRDMRLNTLKPAAGSKACAQARRSRNRQWPRQDRRPRAQRSEVACWFPQGRFRGRPDAAAAPAAEGWFKSRVGRVTGQVRLSELAKVEADVVDMDAPVSG